jgi:hypothetical protein
MLQIAAIEGTNYIIMKFETLRVHKSSDKKQKGK